MRRALGMAAALALAGACGGGVSAEKFAEKAGAECQKAKVELDRLSVPMSLLEVGQYGDKVAGTVEGLAGAVDKMDKPGGDVGGAVKAYVADMRAAAATARKVNQAVAVEDFATVESAGSEAKAALERASARANQFNAPVCADAVFKTAGQVGTASGRSAHLGFLQKADGACARHVDRSVRPPTLLEAVAKERAEREKWVPELEALAAKAPSAKKDVLLKMIDRAKTSLERAKEVAGLGTGAAAVAAIRSFDDAADETDKLASEYGFERCGDYLLDPSFYLP